MIEDPSRNASPVTQLCAWYRTPLGEHVRAQEAERLRRILPDLFGFHLVQVGGAGLHDDLLPECRIAHRVVLEEDCDDRAGVGVLALPECLPFAADSIDALVLVHALDYAQAPHALLREAQRVLVAEGRLVVLGFNPLSLFGLVQLLRRRSGRMPWQGRFVRPARLRDWLALLGFAIEREEQFFFRPPTRRLGLLRRLEPLERLGARWPHWGGAYLMVARKQVMPLTPLRRRVRPRSRLVAPGLAKPTARVRR